MFDHLAPYEAAARIFCQHAGLNPDASQTVPHPVIAGATLELFQWYSIAEQMLHLSRMMVAMKQASAGAVTGQRDAFPTVQ